MKKTLTSLMLSAGLAGPVLSQSAFTGPSTGQTPYMYGTVPGSSLVSVMTAGDSVGTYKMCGIGDGMGAFDNGDGTMTLLLNHELGNTVGSVRAHGQKGAFVSRWIINKSTLAVTAGSDLMQNVNLWTGTTYTTYNSTNPSTLTAFARFCSANLPPVIALYNEATGKGTTNRIFMDGEENGSEGRALAHIVTGAAAGTTYELPHLGKLSFENTIPRPFASDKTVVAELDDSTPGQVYMYIGNKSASGTDIEKGGFFGGKLYGISVSGMISETNTLTMTPNTPFTLVDVGSVANITGAQMNTNSNNLGVTTFLRPEDGTWDSNNPADFYFVITNAFTSPSRLWRLRFYDVEHPEYGGGITCLLNGTEGQKMLDNIEIDGFGHLLLQEDPGANAYVAKVWQYDLATASFNTILVHDSTRFQNAGPNFLTTDEESTGMTSMQEILGAGWFLYYALQQTCAAG
jgi:secreted PhoX family phosphatase